MIDSQIWPAAAALGVWTGIIGTAFTFIVNSIVDRKIKELNGTYRRTKECELTMDPIIDRLNHIEKLIGEE